MIAALSLVNIHHLVCTKKEKEKNFFLLSFLRIVISIPFIHELSTYYVGGSAPSLQKFTLEQCFHRCNWLLVVPMVYHVVRKQSESLTGRKQRNDFVH